MKKNTTVFLAFFSFLFMSFSAEATTFLEYKGNSRYYTTPSGTTFLDRRRVGPLYPTLFDVARKGNSFDYIQSEDEDNGCNLEEMFRTTVFKRYGFDVRRYLNAIATPSSSCNSLGSAEEQNLCKTYHSTPACNGTMPIALEANPLPSGQKYLTYQKNTSCTATSENILKDTYIPKQSKEWAKIEQDLMDKKRSASDFKGQAPTSKIRQEVLAKNPKATQRDIDFAVSEWAYNQSKNATVEVSESEVNNAAEKRYSPASALRNVMSFKNEIGGICNGKESRYNNKMYSEGVNIPAHEILSFADYIDPANGCICRK